MIRKCTCSHRFQDNQYGTGNRVMNPRAVPGWRCTVCDREHIAPVKVHKTKDKDDDKRDRNPTGKR